uniref:Uncharacterized protein n=1 Tax=Glossina palpalis gambiensis TaxID=67801 RepID=A0A1B0C5G7_9MUSC
MPKPTEERALELAFNSSLKEKRVQITQRVIQKLPKYRGDKLQGIINLGHWNMKQCGKWKPRIEEKLVENYQPLLRPPINLPPNERHVMCACTPNAGVPLAPRQRSDAIIGFDDCEGDIRSPQSVVPGPEGNLVDKVSSYCSMMRETTPDAGSEGSDAQGATYRDAELAKPEQ